MKLGDPIGNGVYAPLFIRAALGAFFYLSGRSKLDGLPGYVLPRFVQEVKSYQIFPDQFATVYAILLPYVEIMVAALILLGLWTTLAAGLASLIAASFIYLFGVTTGGRTALNKDVVLLAAAVSLLYSGAGIFSIDKFRKSG